MKQEYKNFGYMLVWVVVATMLLNPTFASQISSNLVKWFVAITSSDVKSENNLVWLDAWGMLPSDVIPAEAATTSWWMFFCWTYMTYEGNTDTESSTVSATCPTWYSQVKMTGPTNWHQSMFTTNAWSELMWFNDNWGSARDSTTICCVQD